MLTFTEAIEETRKNMTAGDVHAPSAIGNDEDDERLDPEWRDAAEQEEEQETPEEERAERQRMRKRFPFEVLKADPDQRKIFGWASIAALDGELIIDKQGDIIPVDELEKAAHDFVLYSRDQGDMHRTIGMGKLIGSVVFTDEKAKCGLFAKDAGGKQICGWWVEFLVDDAFWHLYKNGERLEFSIGGRADVDEVE